MKKIYILLVITIGFLSCSKLDDNLYNSDKLDKYELDAFEGEQDFILGPSYQIPSHLINIFTLNSQMASESSPTTIYAVYIGDIKTINTDTIIMYCHGNKSHMDFYWQRAKLLANVGGKNNYGVLMVDYRGFGMSEGKSSEEGMYADVNAALNWLKSNGLSNDRLIMCGFSLGTAPACELTANTRSMIPHKVILEAPFASAEVMVHDAAVLAMPASFVTSLKIDNAEEIKKISQPFMWIHGTKDALNGFESHGKVVSKNYQGIYKEELVVKGADHSDVPVILSFKKYCDSIDKFIKR